MFPAFHLDNFKPWAPPHRKPFSAQKSSNSCSPRTQSLSPPKPYHNSLPSTLPPPPPKHHLPARPPAEVCVYIGANTQTCTPSSSQFQPRQISAPEPNTYLGDPKLDTTPPNNVPPHTLDLDPISRGDHQDDTCIPLEPPAFRGDFAEDGRPSPSISSFDDSIEEFFRLPDAQDNIPIDPIILSGSWKDSGLQQSGPQADSLTNLEKACPYPDPPPALYSPPIRYRDSSESAGRQNGDAQTSDDPHIYNGQQLHPSQHDADPDASHPKGARGNHVSGQSKCSKRKTQQLDGRRASKRLRVPSALPSTGDSVSALRSHFVSLALDERLQFLSWLFEGALPRCMSDSSPTAREDGDARGTSRPGLPHDIDQNRRDGREAQGSSRKSKKWSLGEMDLLLRLRKDRSRPWSEVIRLFSEKYPGRSPGAIQVFWSTTLNKESG